MQVRSVRHEETVHDPAVYQALTGYKHTNSGGNLVIMNSIFRFNRAGIVPNSGSYELCYPQRNVVIAGNEIGTFKQFETSIPVEPEDIPEHLKQAVIAAEDAGLVERANRVIGAFAAEHRQEYSGLSDG